MKKTLYQMLSFVICIMLVASLFVGCATRNVSNGMKPSDTQTQPENIVDIDILDVDSREPINFNGDEWVEVPVKTLRDADIFFHENNFPEVMLEINEEYLSDDISVSTKENIIKIDVVYMNEPWTMYAAKANDLSQPINLGIQGVPTVRITHDGSDWLSFAGFAGHIAIYDNNNNNNVYICCYQGKKLNTVIMKIVYFNEDAFEYPEDIVYPLDHEVATMGNVQLEWGGEIHTYQYRKGTSLGAWVNSELNTDGWHYAPYSSTTVVSPDDSISAWSDELLSSNIPFSKYGSGSAINDGSWDTTVRYRNGQGYCFKSDCPLSITGFYFDRKPTHSFNGMYDLNLYGTYNFDKVVKLNVRGVTEENFKHCKVFFVNRQPDDITEIPSTADEAALRWENDYMIAEFDASQSQHFRRTTRQSYTPDADVDVFITYDDEIIYRLYLYGIQF